MTDENHPILTYSEVLDKLRSKEWFKNTDRGIQNALLTLPEDFLGFLTDLINRPDELSYSEITRLVDLKFGKFLLLPIFEVRSTETNQISTYEYAASKYGGQSRFRGILLIEKEGKIEYFILAKTEKFPLARFVYEAIGGFIEYRNNRLENMPKNIGVSSVSLCTSPTLLLIISSNTIDTSRRYANKAVRISLSVA